jgi:hypothetical protein
VRLLGEHAGPGKFRGGPGTLRRVTFLASAEVNSIAEARRFPPSGVLGGQPARGNDLLVERDGASLHFSDIGAAHFDLKFANQTVRPGDSVSVVTTGGGGYGDPFERDPELVLADVLEDLCTLDSARADYGVVVVGDGDELHVDVDATRQLRAQGRPPEPHPAADVDVHPAGMSEVGAKAALRVDALRARTPVTFCKTECPLRGSPDHCPLHDAEALGYWNVRNLEQWIGRTCPKAAEILAQPVETSAAGGGA